jgi:leucine-rich repeat protein SHOC2
MRTKQNFVMLGCMALALVFTSCSKDEDIAPVVKSSDKQITSFVFLLTTNPIEVNVVGLVDEETKTITATMPPGTNISGLLPEIVISPGAEVSPNTAQNFTNPVDYTITAEDGSKVVYTATVTAALSQRQILQAILDANPANTLGWNLQNTTELGALVGIRTDVEGNIIELVLPSKELTHCPPEIGQLTTLTFLALSYNQITSIPPEIGQLTKLTRLDFARNQLTSIPPEIGQLTKLTSLGLYENQLSSIPPEIGNLSNLTTLLLYENQLTSIPVEIGNLTNLKELVLRINHITTIPTEFGNLSNLTTLDLSQNQLTSIPPEIGQLTNLESLNLNFNQLISVPKEIGLLTDLQSLSLFKNQLTSIPEEIGFLTELTGLDIRINNLTTFPDAVHYLTLYNNMSLFKDAGVNSKTTSEKDVLISIYSVNPDNTLEWSVDNFPEVSFNDSGSPVGITMNNKNLSRLPTTIGKLSSLKTLNVSQNSFGSIPSGIGNIVTLGVLTLHKTNISTVPRELGKLTNLALLTLTDNPITFIPQNVCDLQISKGGILTILTDLGEGCD